MLVNVLYYDVIPRFYDTDSGAYIARISDLGGGAKGTVSIITRAKRAANILVQEATPIN